MQEKNKKSRQTERVKPWTYFKGPVIDIAKTGDWEKSLNKTERLCLAWCRLNGHQWDEGLLGERPADDFPAYLPREAIERIVGSAEIDHFDKVFIHGWSEEEWLRWYTVERYADRYKYIERKEKSERPIMLVALASMIALLLSLIKIAITHL